MFEGAAASSRSDRGSTGRGAGLLTLARGNGKANRGEEGDSKGSSLIASESCCVRGVFSAVSVSYGLRSCREVIVCRWLTPNIESRSGLGCGAVLPSSQFEPRGGVAFGTKSCCSLTFQDDPSISLTPPRDASFNSSTCLSNFLASSLFAVSSSSVAMFRARSRYV